MSHSAAFGSRALSRRWGGRNVTAPAGAPGGRPPVALVAVIHEPQRRLRQQGAIPPLVRQELHGVGGGFGCRVFGEIQQLVARGSPPGLLLVLFRAALQRGRNLGGATVFGLLQCKTQNRNSVRGQAGTLVINLAERCRVGFPRQRQVVLDVCAQVGSQLRVLREISLQPRGSFLSAIGLHFHSGGLPLPQARHHVC